MQKTESKPWEIIVRVRPLRRYFVIWIRHFVPKLAIIEIMPRQEVMVEIHPFVILNLLQVFCQYRIQWHSDDSSAAAIEA
jgi:hypothetical protein